MAVSSNRYINCAHCESQMADLGHSIIIVLQKISPDGYRFFQCEQGQDYAYANWQHFCCSQACMRTQAEKCLTEHYQEEFLHEIVPGEGSTILDRIVRESVDSCVRCGKPLNGVAYRFCLTYATPLSHSIHTHHELRGWCCSLQCARARAIELLWRKALSTADHA